MVPWGLVNCLQGLTVSEFLPNSMACPYASLHVLAASCTPTVVMQVLTPSVTCTGGLYLQPLSACTLWHMWWSEGCWCWARYTVTCTGGLFFPRAVAHILNACMTTCAVVVVVVVVIERNIVICTV